MSDDDDDDDNYLASIFHHFRDASDRSVIIKC